MNDVSNKDGSYMEAVAATLHCGECGKCGTGSGGRIQTHCPAHDDRNPSLSLTWENGKYLVHCHAGCSQAAVIDALSRKGLWGSNSLAGDDDLKKTNSSEVRLASQIRYEIKDSDGALVAIHERVQNAADDKGFKWISSDGTYGLSGVKTQDLPLYGSETLKDLPDGATVVVVEGEKAKDALEELVAGSGIGIVATVTGAGGTPADDCLRPLMRFQICLWPDNDVPGHQHMNRVAAKLSQLSLAPLIIDWQPAPEKGDAADFVDSGGSIAKMIALIDQAASPKFRELAEWLEKLANYLRKYVVLTPEQTDALALWIAHTHLFEAAYTTPYINITAAEKQSGKTRLLEALSLVVDRPWLSARVTPAVLYRNIDARRPTLLLDESDAVFKGPAEQAQTIRGVLDSGFRRGGASSICVPRGNGFEVKDFNTFCPKAIAGIGELPDTVSDRSIRIELKRKTKNELVEKFRIGRVEAEPQALVVEMRAMCESLVTLAEGRQAELPESLSDRAQDIWEPLAVIADIAGGDWPNRVRRAAVILSFDSMTAGNSVSDGEKMLGDLSEVFDQLNTDQASTSRLLQSLNNDETKPWGEFNFGKPLSAQGLARILKPFGISPTNLRIGGDVVKGYRKRDLEESWSRYMPEKAATAATRTENPAETPATQAATEQAVRSEPEEWFTHSFSPEPVNALDSGGSRLPNINSNQPTCSGVADVAADSGMHEERI